MRTADTHGGKHEAVGPFHKCPMAGRIFGLIAIIAAYMIASSGVRVYAESHSDEYKLKAAFIYNFAKFVEWPDKAFADSDTPITVGIFRDDAFADVVERTVKEKTINGRKVTVKRLDKVADIQKCHVLFVCDSAKAQISDILDRVKESNTLTIGETEGFARRGGIINFVKEGNKLRFEIDVKAAKKAGLKISSKLLKLAKTIED